MLSKLLVKRGQLALFDPVDIHVELRGLARDVLVAIVLGHRQRETLVFAARQADELFGEARRRRRAVGVDDVLGLLAVDDRFVVAFDAGLEVEAHSIPHRHRALDRRPLCVGLAQALDHVVDLLVANLGFLWRNPQRVLVVAQFNFRRQTDYRFEAERIELDGFHTRSGVRLDLLLLHGFGDDFGDEPIERLLHDPISAKHPLDHRAGGFAAPEPGHIHATGQASIRVINGSVQAVLVDLDVQGNLAGRQLGGGNLHSGIPSFSREVSSRVVSKSRVCTGTRDKTLPCSVVPLRHPRVELVFHGSENSWPEQVGELRHV